jgi:histidinol phosphatase-like PHP family hydrolase
MEKARSEEMKIEHDLHIHTWLSSCSGDPDAGAENYIRLAAEKGLKVIGFANHFWDNRVPGASDWYRPQDFSHIMKIKEQIPEDRLGVKVLVGCETEYCGRGKVGITRETAEQLDFVLIPMSHLHMKGFVLDQNVTSSEEAARVMVDRFKEVIELGLATGIAHPFLPFGFDPVDEILSCISDDEFVECFGRAAELGISMELNASSFPGSHGKERDTFHDETFIRVFSLAKACGCLFHFASDAHSPKNMHGLFEMEAIVNLLGITEDHILPLCRA